jgi:hypothetical protein
MMGPTKLGTMRAEVRKAFKMPDAEILAWFNRQLEELAQKPKVIKAEKDTLRLLRDALVKEVKRAGSGSRPRRLTGHSKS